MERFLREIDLEEFKQELEPPTGWVAPTQNDHDELETVDMILEDIRQFLLHSDDQASIIENHARSTLSTLNTLQKGIMATVALRGIVQDNYDRAMTEDAEQSEPDWCDSIAEELRDQLELLEQSLSARNTDLRAAGFGDKRPQAEQLQALAGVQQSVRRDLEKVCLENAMGALETEVNSELCTVVKEPRMAHTRVAGQGTIGRSRHTKRTGRPPTTECEARNANITNPRFQHEVAAADTANRR